MGSRYHEYLEHADEYYRSEPLQRIGQAYYNALYELYTEFATTLVGTNLDPFCNDGRLDEFLVAVKEQLDGPAAR
jgi:hypothetical protein